MQRSVTLTVVLVACSLLGLVTVAQRPEPGKQGKPRVQPKKFDSAESSRVFFDDIFSALVGPRPDVTQQGPAATAGTASPSPGSSASNSGSSGNGDGGWSRWISATTIENEIKMLKQAVDQDVTTPGDFKGRGYQACRTHFSVAAMLFTVIHEFDGQVRWKSDATTARDVFARTAANAKVGTTQVFNEAKQRKQDLEDLLNGNSLPARPSESGGDWSNVADRSPLMLRLEKGFRERLQQMTSSESALRSQKDEALHEAEMITAICEVLTKEGMVDADDETYVELAQATRDAALEAVTAIKDLDYAMARAAAGKIDQACIACHDSYR